MNEPAPGILLLSDPFLKDPNFVRSVIFLCDHQKEGSFGFVINKLITRQIGDLIEEAEGIRFPVYNGGPVQKDTLHFLHQCPSLIGGQEVTDGIYWGGDFVEVISLLKQNLLGKTDIRFFLGYSGWEEGQLENEMKERSWIGREATRQLVFTQNAAQLWKTALEEMGGEYSQMVNYPTDPQLN